MHAPPPGRVKPVLVIVAIIVVLVVALELLGRRLPAFHSIARDVVVVVVTLGIVALIRSLLPRREQRRHGERRHAEERRHRA
jgi:hypothetical protein